MKGHTIGLALSLGLATTAVPIRAQAQDTAAVHGEAGARSEAGDRFDRGLRLINAGDNAGALVEFRRAYSLVPNVVVLYNIGLLYAQMGRSVEATAALGNVLTSPGTLSLDRLERARRVRDEQAARVAEVDVRANVEGARIEVDGVETGKTPAAAPLRVTSGTHVVGLVAPGFTPQRKEIALAGGEKQSLVFELVAMQGRLARVLVKTHLPGADLYADDQRIGTTPLAASVTLAPGRHRLELRRAGYSTASTEVTLSDG
ncbi:MAG TPA: PEGA domain-containing protein, partial [Polyangiaceae bacterium]|nr:PEGA domain-containing protein [Polyangiaceae bacterium]